MNKEQTASEKEPSSTDSIIEPSDSALKEDESEKMTTGAEELDKLFPAEPYMEDFAALVKKLYRQDEIVVEEYGFMEILSAVDVHMKPLSGKRLKMQGFVYREPDMAATQFAVARLSMSCCAADAMPYGVMLESPEASDYVNDQWVSVEGTIGQGKYQGFEIMVLRDITLRVIDAPAVPYVYPVYDYFEKMGLH